ncbi:MAG: HlyC/CorC family transporter, partial [Lachnospiraceae bacterium]|nr:HlyC/CorC family transporter [Lachnospiraceae bacterium]
MDEGGSRNPFLRLFSKKKTDDEQMEQEIISMVDEAHEQGALRESESMMIHNVLALDEKEAKDIMTHRKNIVAIDGNTPFSKAMDFIIEETHSRFPVYEEDIDNIIGAIHIREVLMYAKDPSVQNMPIKDIPNLIFEVDFIPETKNLDALFKEMQMKKSHIVIVVDEYGQTAGIVALEDILEEIVGNILDEHDEEEHTIEQLTEDTWMMQGMTPLEEVSEILGIPFDLEDYETLNGYLISRLDRIPLEGENPRVGFGGYTFEVIKAGNKMIESIHVFKDQEEEGDSGKDREGLRTE